MSLLHWATPVLICRTLSRRGLKISLNLSRVSSIQARISSCFSGGSSMEKSMPIRTAAIFHLRSMRHRSNSSPTSESISDLSSLITSNVWVPLAGLYRPVG